jgi:hypothetical protein
LKRQQQQQQMNKGNTGTVTTASTSMDNSWASYLPHTLTGWMTGISSTQDGQQHEERDVGATGSIDSSDIDLDTADANPQLWELAKHEGDEKYHAWLESHIWTVSACSGCLQVNRKQKAILCRLMQSHLGPFTSLAIGLSVCRP